MNTHAQADQALFSRRGQPPNELERTLVGLPLPAPGRMAPWLALARRFGPDLIAALLDELGGSSVYVPKREMFFRGLHRSARVSRAHTLAASGLTPSEIAEQLGVSDSTARDYLAERPDPVSAEDLRISRRPSR